MRTSAFPFALAAALLGVACADSGPTAAGQSVVTFSLATRSSPPAARTARVSLGANLAGADTTILGQDTVIITRAEIVLREVELKRVEIVDCDSSGSDSTQSDDGCEELTTGPLLLDLPLGPGVQPVIQVAVLPGAYDELEFDIHKPEDDGVDPADVAFLSQHPDFKRISMRIQGTWNGAPFVYETDLNVEQELDLFPPLTIDAPGTHEVVLLVDLATFFVNATGSGLVDPGSANKGGPNESLVTENVKRSFEAFENDA